LADDLKEEKPNGDFDYKEGARDLGVFKDGKWDESGIMTLIPPQIWASGLDEILPDREYYAIVTPEMLEKLERKLPKAKTADKSRQRRVGQSFQGAPSQIQAFFAASAAEDTVESFIADFVGTARQALAELSQDHDIVVWDF
jgi:hypothetical protein